MDKIAEALKINNSGTKSVAGAAQRKRTDWWTEIVGGGWQY
jgi:hypothetical protein